MKISIISDTHGYLDEQIIAHVKKSNEIWHAGDIGSAELIDQLEGFAGVFRAVYGNIDDHKVRLRTSEDQCFEIDGFVILMTHIAGKPPNYNQRTRKLIKEHKPNLLVCGHSHILRVENDKKNSLLFINPGACGHHGFHRVRTIIQFELINGKPANMQVVELGRRGKIKA